MSEPSSDLSAQVELFSEGWLFAALLGMVIEHCGVGRDGLVSSFGRRSDARAMRRLAEAGYIRIVGERGDDIEARVTSPGRDLLATADRFEETGR